MSSLHSLPNHSGTGSAIRVRQIAPSEASRVPEWADALRTFNPETTRALKQEDRGSEGNSGGVFLARLAGKDVVVKVIPLSLWGRVKAWMGQSRGWRQWQGTQILESVGIPTASALVLATRSSPGAELLVLQALSGPTLLRVMNDAQRVPLSPLHERQLVNGLARTIGGLHALGYWNRDGKPSNFIVVDGSSESDGVPRVAVIDAVAIRRQGADGGRGLARMLASLVIEPTGCGISVRRTLRRRVMRAILTASWAASPEATWGAEKEDAEDGFARWERASARHFWKAAVEIITAHGRAKPRVDPLTI